ncbi:MAG: tetratricopeptide repeat protein [Candidatus Kapabacteria bacterium]|nr:tetratricopeptide repeat protein [Candidatus Kapabacteria bacterium]
MTHEQLKTKVEELEALVKSGNDHAIAETQARELLEALSIGESTGGDRELHCRTLLALVILLNERGLAKDALQYAEQALALIKQSQDIALEARAIGNVGTVYEKLSDYVKALDCYYHALALDEKLGKKDRIARHIGVIGIVYAKLADYPKALEYMSRALTVDEELNNKQGVANHTGNIGSVYWYLSDYPKALEYFSRALNMAEILNNTQGIAHWIGNMGSVHEKLSDYPMALEYYNRALSINEQIGNKGGAATIIGNMGNVYWHLSDYPKALDCFTRALALDEELGNKNGVARHTGNIGALCSKQNLTVYDAVRAEGFLLDALSISTEVGDKVACIEFHKNLADFYEQEGRITDAYSHFKKYTSIRELLNIEETRKQEAIREQQKQIEIARTRATAEKRILNNILPEEITQRLIKGENPIADTFDCVSVLFMDIIDFTKLSTKISAEHLVHLLNAIFTVADGVMREFGLEKIKTIGDAYMAVAGAPVVQQDHAHRAANAALKLLELMQNLEVSFPDSLGDKSWIESLPEIHVRIGLHCGPVAAGVVGENKFLYDLWGDAVNTASRMESYGEAGRIHVSEEFVRTLFPSQTLPEREGFSVPDESFTLSIGEGRGEDMVRAIPRGNLDIKGKGIMRTFFLERG